jgi:glycosyltransferase involved in cell wall biosynthesis
MKLTAGLRVKNGELWAEECLASLSRFVDAIVVLDDGSTDRTGDICRSSPKVAHCIRWEKSFFQEGLDRNLVLALAKDTDPDWILMMDIDEVFEDRIVDAIGPMLQQEDCAVWGFRMLHFWRGRTHFRMDASWGHETRHHIHPRLFRNQPGLHYPTQTIHGAHVLGLEGRAVLSDVIIKHYGYSYDEKIIEKYQLYSRVDPEGNYRHLLSEEGALFVEYREGMDIANVLAAVPSGTSGQ